VAVSRGCNAFGTGEELQRGPDDDFESLSMTHSGYRQRLYDAAEAFYFAGILTSLPFNASADVRQQDLSNTANAMISGMPRRNDLGAPPIVNFGFAIELYIKLLRHLADKQPMRGHNLHELFQELEKAAPAVTSRVICVHHYARGNRDEFLDYIRIVASVFDDWRYAHEKEFLCSSADTLFVLANAFRSAIKDLHPDMTSAFSSHPPSPASPPIT